MLWCKSSCQITEERLQLTFKSQSSVVHVNMALLSGVINFTIDIHSFTSEVAVDRQYSSKVNTITSAHPVSVSRRLYLCSICKPIGSTFTTGNACEVDCCIVGNNHDITTDTCNYNQSINNVICQPECVYFSFHALCTCIHIISIK